MRSMQTAWDEHEAEVEERLHMLRFMFLFLETDMACGMVHGRSDRIFKMKSQLKAVLETRCVACGATGSGWGGGAAPSGMAAGVMGRWGL